MCVKTFIDKVATFIDKVATRLPVLSSFWLAQCTRKIDKMVFRLIVIPFIVVLEECSSKVGREGAI